VGTNLELKRFLFREYVLTSGDDDGNWGFGESDANTFRGTIPTSFDRDERVVIVVTSMSRSETRRVDDHLGQNATKDVGQISEHRRSPPSRTPLFTLTRQRLPHYICPSCLCHKERQEL
jgi:hypothetical protein